MGKIKYDWQDRNSVLNLFGDTCRKARNAYLAFVKKGVEQGRRPQLVGGGLLRSHGDWAALKALQSAGIWVMGDERILGSGDFVETALRKANEQYDKRTHAQASGMDLKQLIIAVAQARLIICCVAVDRLKLSGAEVARKLELSPSTVSKLASRGRKEKLTSEIADYKFGYRSTKDPSDEKDE